MPGRISLFLCVSDISFTQLSGLIYGTHDTLNNMKVCFQEEVLMDKCISTEKVSDHVSLWQIYFSIQLFQNFDREMKWWYFLSFLIVLGVLILCFILLLEVYIWIVEHYLWNRPYYSKCTRSHPNSEVKRDKAGLVLRWGTAWETPVLIPF